MTIYTSGSVTHAGWRIIKGVRNAWNCFCGEHNPRYLSKCRVCDAPYPKEK